MRWLNDDDSTSRAKHDRSVRTKVTQITRNRSSDVAFEAKTNRDAQWQRSIIFENIEHCLRNSKERTRMSIYDKKKAYLTRTESLTLEEQSTRILCVDCALRESDVVLSYVFWTCLRCKLTNHRLFETDHLEHRSDERIKRVYWFVKNRFVRLIHLVRNTAKFDMQTSIRICDVIKQFSSHVRVLRVQIDSRLKWDAHLRSIQKKMTIQSLTLSRLTAFTWNACFSRVKLIYSVVVRSTIIYDSIVWQASHERSNSVVAATKKFIKLQQQNLRQISDNFKAVSMQILEAKTHVQLIQLHMTRLQISFKQRMKKHKHDTLIKRFCEQIKHRLFKARERRRRYIDETSTMRKIK